MSRLRQAAKRILCRFTPGYLLYLRWFQGCVGPTGRPAAPWHNAVLKSQKEVTEALAQVRALGLPAHDDGPKNWDSLAALDAILAGTGRDARVLDAGATAYSTLLPCLALYGYRNLLGIDLSFAGTLRLGPITYARGDLTEIACPNGHFDAVACLSVIEHGVDLECYFAEMARVLKPGGLLITSCDYWCQPVACDGKRAFGVPVKLFTPGEVEQALGLAGRHGFEPSGPLDLACGDKVVHWAEVELDFTFIVITLRKRSDR